MNEQRKGYIKYKGYYLTQEEYDECMEVEEITRGLISRTENFKDITIPTLIETVPIAVLIVVILKAIFS